MLDKETIYGGFKVAGVLTALLVAGPYYFGGESKTPTDEPTEISEEHLYVMGPGEGSGHVAVECTDTAEDYAIVLSALEKAVAERQRDLQLNERLDVSKYGNAAIDCSKP